MLLHFLIHNKKKIYHLTLFDHLTNQVAVQGTNQINQHRSQRASKKYPFREAVSSYCSSSMISWFCICRNHEKSSKHLNIRRSLQLFKTIQQDFCRFGSRHFTWCHDSTHSAKGIFDSCVSNMTIAIIENVLTCRSLVLANSQSLVVF